MHGRGAAASFAALETRRMMSSELNNLRLSSSTSTREPNRQIAKLSNYGAELEALSSQNDEDIELWTAALKRARRRAVPKEVRDRTASILQGLREGSKMLQAKTGEVLAYQSRALDVRDVLRIAQQKVSVALRAEADSVFEQQEPPIWKAAERLDDQTVREGYDLNFSWPAVKDYLLQKRTLLIFQIFMALLLGVLFTQSARDGGRKNRKASAGGSASLGRTRRVRRCVIPGLRPFS